MSYAITYYNTIAEEIQKDQPPQRDELFNILGFCRISDQISQNDKNDKRS